MVKQIEDKNIEDRFREDWTYEQRVAVLAQIGRQIEERLAKIDGRLNAIEAHGALLLTRANILIGTILTLITFVILTAMVMSKVG